MNLDVPFVTASDILACFSYFLNIMDGIGLTDDIDHLGNRRVKCVGELVQGQFRIGLTRMEKPFEIKCQLLMFHNLIYKHWLILNL